MPLRSACFRNHTGPLKDLENDPPISFEANVREAVQAKSVRKYGGKKIVYLEHTMQFVCIFLPRNFLTFLGDQRCVQTNASQAIARQILSSHA